MLVVCIMTCVGVMSPSNAVCICVSVSMHIMCHTGNKLIVCLDVVSVPCTYVIKVVNKKTR